MHEVYASLGSRKPYIAYSCMKQRADQNDAPSSWCSPTADAPCGALRVPLHANSLAHTHSTCLRSP